MLCLDISGFVKFVIYMWLDCRCALFKNIFFITTKYVCQIDLLICILIKVKKSDKIFATRENRVLGRQSNI